LAKASTDAAIGALTLYGPHAIGFTLVAIPVLVVVCLAHLIFDTPAAISAPVAVAALVVNAAFGIWQNNHRPDSQGGRK
jgi:hypothetical protein